MRRSFHCAGFVSAVFLGCIAAASAMAAPMATIQTSMGDIVLDLDREHTPATVDNFVRYAKEGHFDGTVFYRVVPGFVIQAGSYDSRGMGRPVHDPIPLETANAGSNLRGTIAMGRAAEPDSARAEFFINLADTKGLDRQPDDMDNKTGYAVFGHVTSGMEVVDAIATVPLGGGVGPFGDAAPVLPVVIRKVVISDN
ncbi:MAG TPA: peptidylprolyl isomerase [Micropepsaceae bacterium]|nr:peptidylprolyl isomerase [Micropepsaceae bacterium]